MNSLIGYEGRVVIKSIVQAKRQGKEWWREISQDVETSIPAFLQNSDKSRTTVKTSGLIFYTFHVLIMYLKHDINKHMIARGQTVVACLPTKVFWKPKLAKCCMIIL